MPEPVCTSTWEEKQRSTVAERQLEEQHCLGHVATREKMRHVHMPGLTVRDKNHIKEKASKADSADGRNTDGVRGKTRWQCYCTYITEKRNAATINILVTESKIKRLAHKLMRQKGAREIGLLQNIWIKKSTPIPEAWQIAAFSTYRHIYKQYMQRWKPHGKLMQRAWIKMCFSFQFFSPRFCKPTRRHK